MFGFFQKAQDPVCKMKVDRNKAKYSSEYKGEKYHFCSENCKSQFDANPKDYVEENKPPSSARFLRSLNKTSSCCQTQTKAPADKSYC